MNNRTRWGKAFFAVMGLAAIVSLVGCSGSGDGQDGSSLANQFEKATHLGDSPQKVSSLVDVANKAIAANDTALARKCLASAKATADKLEAPSHKAQGHIDVASVYVGLGESSAAKESLELARAACRDIPDTDAESKATVLAGLARGQSQTGNTKFAMSLLGDVAKYVEKVDDPAGKTIILVRMAETQHDLKDAQASGKSYEQAFATAKGAGSADKQAAALLTIAESQTRLQKKAEAQKTFSEAVQAAQEVEDANRRAYLLADIAVSMARSGQKDEAQQALADAKASAERIKAPSLKDDALAYIRGQRGKL